MSTTDHCFPTEQCSLVFIYLFMVWSAEADFLHGALFSLNPKNPIFASSTPVHLCLFSRSLNPRFKPSCTGHACRTFEEGWQRQNKSYKSSSVLNSHANRIKTQQLLWTVKTENLCAMAVLMLWASLAGNEMHTVLDVKVTYISCCLAVLTRVKCSSMCFHIRIPKDSQTGGSTVNGKCFRETSVEWSALPRAITFMGNCGPYFPFPSPSHLQ